MTPSNEDHSHQSSAGHMHEPLLRMLLVQCALRGESHAALAERLGVTPDRLGQWRRGEASMKGARRSVHEAAARYLGIPTVAALMLAGLVGVTDFVWPHEESTEVRLERELQRMAQDPFFGGLMPSSLASAPQDIRLLVAFLYREVREGAGASPGRGWLDALRRLADSPYLEHPAAPRHIADGRALF